MREDGTSSVMNSKQKKRGHGGAEMSSMYSHSVPPNPDYDEDEEEDEDDEELMDDEDGENVSGYQPSTVYNDTNQPAAPISIPLPQSD